MKTLDAAFFGENRKRVIEQLQGSLLVVSAYTQMQRGNDMAFQFEQEANFWYLTGIEHPDWWLIIDGKRGKSWLVAPQVDEVHALFDGSLSRDDAAEISGVSEVLEHAAGLAHIRQAARSHQFVYTVDPPQHHDHFGFVLNPAVRDMHEQLTRIFTRVQDFRPQLAEIRAIKQPLEIELMQDVIDITTEAFEEVVKKLPSYRYEYQVEAEFSHYFRSNGARGHAYDPIVASGKNACTLHYTQNESLLKKGNLLLVDVGARRHGYAADVTRTYAIGKPTKRQQAVHQEVIAAQRDIIDLLQPDLGIEEYQREVDTIMKRALIRLKLIKDEKDEAYRTYFPHAISHGLGVDVHDSLGKPKYLQPGMVLTVEPGIYIPEEGIGVRIEDDILITEAGFYNMSGKLSTDIA